MTIFMVTSWLTALHNYNYYANLAEYANRDKCSDGFTIPSFTAAINGSNTKIFEESFRAVIEAKLYSKYSIVGEVCFWKLFNKQDPNSLTTRMLHLLKKHENFLEFCINLHKLAENPQLNNFKKFRQSCGQSNGFAVPVTFLSFYRSTQYPMADAYVSLWWNKNKQKFGYGSSNDFFPEGRISGETKYVDHNWGAYGQWTHFCQKYSSILTSMTQIIWRARDVEMAVFYNQQNGGSILNNLEGKPIQFKHNNESQQLKSEIFSNTIVNKNPELKKEGHRLLVKAIALQNENHWLEALKICESAIKLDPTNPNTWLNMALCLQKLSRYEDERKCYLKILESDPNNQHAKMGLNFCLKRLNKPEEAELYNPFLGNYTNYAPKQYSYWSDGGGRR